MNDAQFAGKVGRGSVLPVDPEEAPSGGRQGRAGRRRQGLPPRERRRRLPTPPRSSRAAEGWGQGPHRPP